MKLLNSIAAAGLLASLAIAQTGGRQYTVRDLGPLRGGDFSQASGVNNRGLVIGVSTDAEGVQHSVVWYQGWIGDLGKSVLGGPNSGLFGINDKGSASGQAESANMDPTGENFCGYGTGLKCLPFLWQDGVVTQLATLGGNNASVGQINNRGEVSGYAETGVEDPDCKSRPEDNGMGPQVQDFEAVIWGPKPGQIRRLEPLHGDTVGIAIWINDKGQVVGATGTCSTVVLPPLPAVGLHAVLWDADGSVHDLGNLGGTLKSTMPAHGNIALSINNRTQVVGASLIAGNTAQHAFLWTKETGMKDLGTLEGDVLSAGLSINDRGEIVGPSVDAEGNPRPFLRRGGKMTDLNELVPEDSPLYLLIAFAINSSGQIAGFGVQKDEPHEVHAFLATPRRAGGNDDAAPETGDASVAAPDGVQESHKVSIPENVRKIARERLPFWKAGTRAR